MNMPKGDQKVKDGDRGVRWRRQVLQIRPFFSYSPRTAAAVRFTDFLACSASKLQFPGHLFVVGHQRSSASPPHGVEDPGQRGYRRARFAGPDGPARLLPVHARPAQDRRRGLASSRASPLETLAHGLLFDTRHRGNLETAWRSRQLSGSPIVADRLIGAHAPCARVKIFPDLLPQGCKILEISGIPGQGVVQVRASHGWRTASHGEV